MRVDLSWALELVLRPINRYAIVIPRLDPPIKSEDGIQKSRNWIPAFAGMTTSYCKEALGTVH